MVLNDLLRKFNMGSKKKSLETIIQTPFLFFIEPTLINLCNHLH